ncbi:MAG: mycofactocin-coupled SDR family oxidoreductase [Desulfobacca sp.]|uniref:mycofactocin-coupled SDR family oxidoreductase n=1 Tax=Desulfobacca sp. TaxID=2067990 RepID=UPI00404923A4
MKLAGKVAIVTGGARGNGFAIAKLMAQEGADIAIADICADIPTVPYPLSTLETMEKAVAEIQQLGRRAVGIRCDVRKAEEVQGMVQQVLDTLGRVDILVNNAGTATLEALVDMSEETWDDMLDVHLKGAFLCCKYVVPHLIEQHSGKIINISSVGGTRGFGMGSHYCAAKHGLIGLTKSLAMETADHNINVNVVCPGTVWTDMMAGLANYFGMETEEAKENFFSGHLFKDREITPEDVGRAVLWLATEDSRLVTGAVIMVDAGWTCRAP